MVLFAAEASFKAGVAAVPETWKNLKRNSNVVFGLIRNSTKMKTSTNKQLTLPRLQLRSRAQRPRVRSLTPFEERAEKQDYDFKEPISLP